MTAKSIIIDSLSTPDRLGYNDRGTVLFDDVVVWHDSLSACPNPYKPSIGTPWKECYGWIAPLSTEWECVNSPKHGKCLLLNGGGELPARFPNANHDGRLVVSEVELHCGFDSQWRGSSACATVRPDLWPDFIKYFEIGDKGQIAIIDKTQGGIA
jgi:hypothetical protein